MNNIEIRTTTFKKPVGVHIMDGGKIVRTRNDVKSITEESDVEGDTLVTFIDSNGEYLNSIYLVGTWNYFVF